MNALSEQQVTRYINTMNKCDHKNHSETNASGYNVCFCAKLREDICYEANAENDVLTNEIMRRTLAELKLKGQL